MRKLVTLLLILLCLSGYSININVDSLIQKLPYLPDDSAKVNLLINIARALRQVNADRSVYYGNEAFKLAKRINYGMGCSSSLANISYTYYNQSNFRMAMELFLKKIKLDDSIGNKTGMAYTLNLIGNVYYRIKDYSKALDYYQQGLKLFKELNLEEGVGNIYTCIANIYKATNEIQKAEHYYIIGLNIHEKINDKVDIAISNNNLGNLYYEDYKDKSAVKFFIKARQTLPDVPEMWVHALVYNNYGDYFLWLNRYDSALYYLNLGLEYAKRYKIPEYEKAISQSLATIYAHKNDYKKAYHFQRICTQLNDSIFSMSESAKTAFLDYQFNLDRAESNRAIEMLRQERKFKTRLWILIVATILLGAFATVLSIYHKSKIRHEKLEREKVSIESQRLHEQLEYRNKEVVIIMMNLYERNELIRQVIQKLKTIMPDVKKAAQPQLEAIVLDLKGRYHENIVSEFEQRFQKVHTNFYSNLISQYPSLTAYDLRLCAFLRMNMNTKDIASLIHQTVNSVEVARTRLRKKLNLHQTDTDLAAFLAKF